MRISSRELGRSIFALGLAVNAVACDVPTAAPKWNTTWQVPADSSEIGVASLLPPAVSVVTVDGVKAFEIGLPGSDVAKSLGQMCPACASADGYRVPKPEFTLADSSTIALPNDVASADLVGGAVDYTMTHDFGFDPLNPSADGSAPKGWFTIRVRSGSTVLAIDSVNGANLTMPRNVARTRTIDVPASPAAPLRVSGPLTVTVTLYSPAGDSVTLNSAQSFHVNAVPRGLRVSQASVAVPPRSITARRETVDLSGLGGEVQGRVQGGAFILTVRNPFAVQGSLTATLTAPGETPITKNLVLPLGGDASPPTELRVSLSADELARLLGRNAVAVDVSGTVSAPGGPVTVTPAQVFGVTTILEVILSTTGL